MTTPSETDPPRPEIDPALARSADGRSSPEIPSAASSDSVPNEPPDDLPSHSTNDAPDDSTNDSRNEGEVSSEDRAAVVADTAGEEGAPPSDVDVADPEADALAAIPLSVRVEAALFAAVEPLPVKRLKEITGCPDGRLLAAAIDLLRSGYHGQGRAFRIEETSRGYQIRTVPEVAVIVHRMGRRPPSEEKLSPAALETLAVVAYRQPVMRADIEKIRGVACGEVLRALQERGLVRVAGRADQPGSPILYGTTQRFLEIFGLRAIEELPRDREVLRG